VLGYDPDTGLEVTLRTGRFGPYLQLGEAASDEKPKRSSIPKGIDAATIDLEKALQLLSLPRDVGLHPEGGMITAGLGRFGPFVKHENTYANVESIEDVFTIGVNRAVTLIADKKAGKGGRFGKGAPAKQVLKDLGEHPELGGKIEVLNGRYGPYIAHNKVFANVPKDTEPTAVTVDQAVSLLAERAAKGGAKKAKKAPAKKAPAKKAAKIDGDAPKKPAAKKAKASKAKADADAD
jgi:DNA topoisomerase-1